MKDVLLDIFMAFVVGIIFPLLTAGIGLLIAHLQAKYKDTKFGNLTKKVVDIIKISVKTTYQTYVKAQKKAGTFDEEAQKKALADTIRNIHAMLPPVLEKGLILYFPEVDKWITYTD